MKATLYFDLRPSLDGVTWYVPDRVNVDDEPPQPILFGQKRLRVEIRVPEPYDKDQLRVYVEEVGVGRIHVPPPNFKGGKLK